MIEADKFLHFIISFLIAQISPIVAVYAGIGKEVFDAVSGGFADPLDLIADAWGIAMGILL